MSRRSSLALLVVVACGGAEHHDATTPADEAPGCPSEAAPEKCRDLAQAAAGSNGPLAWAYTVLECQSPGAGQCVAMWQSYAKLAPTQTDALNVLHAACDHNAAACEALAAWHTQRGHTAAAAAYQKRASAAGQAQPRTANALALATDLAAIMHAADAPPRTETISQMIGRELRAPIMHAVAASKAKPKAWAMHPAQLSSSSDDKCAPTAKLDREQVPLSKCVSEVRPFDEGQIAVRNRCKDPVTVAYAGARADHTTFVKQVRLEPFEALSAGITHAEVGSLTYAVCAGGCRVTSSPDDVTASWAGTDGYYYCAAGGQP